MCFGSGRKQIGSFDRGEEKADNSCVLVGIVEVHDIFRTYPFWGLTSDASVSMLLLVAYYVFSVFDLR